MKKKAPPKRRTRDPMSRGWRMPLGQVPQVAEAPANRVFDVGEGTPAKKWILDLGSLVRTEILRSHHISDEALQALVDGDHARFITERAQTLMTLERAFMAEKGVRPPISNLAAASAIDVEDQAPLTETDSTDAE